jgi:hypothetical protein
MLEVNTIFVALSSFSSHGLPNRRAKRHGLWADFRAVAASLLLELRLELHRGFRDPQFRCPAYTAIVDGPTLFQRLGVATAGYRRSLCRVQ